MIKLKINELRSLIKVALKKWEVQTLVEYNGELEETGIVYEEGGRWFFLPTKGTIPVRFENFSEVLRWLKTPEKNM